MSDINSNDSIIFSDISDIEEVFETESESETYSDIDSDIDSDTDNSVEDYIIVPPHNTVMVDNKVCIHLSTNMDRCPYGECGKRNSILYEVDIDKSKLDKFNQNLLDNFNYDNVVIAGGSISKMYLNVDENSDLYKNSDIDMYLYGTQEEKKKKLQYILNFFKYTVVIPYNNVFTMYFRGKTRTIQIICGFFKNKYDILKGFDYAHVQILYDGDKFLATKLFLEHIKKNQTDYNFQRKISIFRIYKTLLLGLEIINYKQPYELNINGKLQTFEKEEFFKLISENKTYEKELKKTYYPGLYESLDEVKDKIQQIYKEKYNMSKFIFKEIVNNLDFIDMVDWDCSFNNILEHYFHNSNFNMIYIWALVNKLYIIYHNNDYIGLKHLKSILYKETDELEHNYYFETYLVELFIKVCKKGNIHLIYSIFTLFKKTFFKTLNLVHLKKQVLLASYENGNNDVILLIKKCFNLSNIKMKMNKIEKKELLLSLLKGSNIELD